MNKITVSKGVLNVPDNVVIPYIEGDGVGAEITLSMKKIVDAAVKKVYNGSRSITWKELLAGEKVEKEIGTPLPEETLNAFKEYIVGIKGPLTTPVGEGRRSLNVALRQELDLYVCLRPVRWYKGVCSPLKKPEDVNMTVFRENTEDIYAGIEWPAESPQAEKFCKFLVEEMNVNKIRFPKTSAFGVKPVSIEGTERLVRSAIKYAIDTKAPSVCIVHKGNIMKYTEGGFKKWAYDLAEREFDKTVFTMRKYNDIYDRRGRGHAENAFHKAVEKGKVIMKDVIADAFLQNSLLYPTQYSVIATLNLNGDYISDQLAAMVGGIGISPGANINYNTGHAVFEATHGTAPIISGKNIVDPCSMILSAVMMLEYMGWNEAAESIVKAIEASFAEKKATMDLARFMDGGVSLSTTQFTYNVIDKL